MSPNSSGTFEHRLELGQLVADTAARAKARRLGIVEKREKTSHDPGDRAPIEQTVRLLDKDIDLVADADGVLLAAGSDGKPASAAPVNSYIGRAFGDRRGGVRSLATPP